MFKFFNMIIQYISELSCMELGTGRETVRDGTKTEPIFVLFYNVPFKVSSPPRSKFHTT